MYKLVKLVCRCIVELSGRVIVGEWGYTVGSMVGSMVITYNEELQRTVYSEAHCKL